MGWKRHAEAETGAMILNGYSVLALFFGAVELGLGVVVAVLAVRALLARRRAPAGALEPDALPLLPLAGGALLGVSLASWPLLYLLLASYVPQWRDVMCIQGVALIGTGSLGASGWLPTLVQTLQVTKPLLVFAAGAWLVLHLSDRRTRTSPLAGRVWVAVGLCGALAVVDAAAQVAYVAIPKREESLSVGCCIAPGVASAAASAAGGDASAPRPPRGALAATFFAASLALAAWTGGAVPGRRGDAGPGPRASGALLLGTIAALPIGAIFLREVAAPAFLGLPAHRCAYCLVGGAPLGVLAIGLFLLGALGTAWCWVAARFGDVPETREFLPRAVASGLRWASFGWAGAAVLAAAALAVA
jgi:hypothetical protein